DERGSLNMRSRSANEVAASGFGSMKMWRWSNAAIRRVCLDSSMPLANTSPGMSPAPDPGEACGWPLRPRGPQGGLTGCPAPIAAERAEVALDRFPGALRGDAHALVVVADRAARGERIAEPEAVVAGDRVGNVGKRRRALVGCDDEIGIVAVVTHAILRMHDLAFDEVVGDVEQAVDEQPVAGDALGEHRVPVADPRPALDPQ